MKILKYLAATLVVVFAVGPAYAQGAYPNKPVKIIVPFPPGQATDIIGRLVAQKLAEKWGQSVYVENRAGAGGITGVEMATKAPADGYTLLVAGSGPLSISPAINSKLTYVPLRDLQPLGLVATMPMVLVSAPSFQAQTLADLLVMLRNKPDDLSYASSGTGSTGQLATELLLSMSKTKMVHVPYKGGAQAMTDVIAGRVPVTVESQAGVLPLITGGQLRPIAVTSAKRSSKLPNVPTFAETGLAGFDVSAWIGVLGPVRMPPAIFKKIADDVASVINTKEMRDRVFELGLELEPMSADQFASHIKLEIEKYTAIAKAANIQAE